MFAAPKLARAAALMLALAGLSASALSVSNAQTKDAPKSKETAKAKKAGKVVISEGKDGKFRYAIRNADDKYIVGSLTGYKTAKDAEKAYEELKEIIAGAKVELGKKKETDDDEEMPAKGKKGKGKE